jgi:hypothetical protein
MLYAAKKSRLAFIIVRRLTPIRSARASCRSALLFPEYQEQVLFLHGWLNAAYAFSAKLLKFSPFIFFQHYLFLFHAVFPP